MEYANLNPNDRIFQCRARLGDAKGDVICPVSDTKTVFFVYLLCNLE
jgi:hypothetical protein